MADDPPRTSSEAVEPTTAESPKEDAETKATREELKQTAISDKAAVPSDDEKPAKIPKLGSVNMTPPDESLKEHISSPKKKRPHEDVDEAHETSSSASASGSSPRDGAASRTDRLEPEKKRARDADATEEAAAEKSATKPSGDSTKDSDTKSSTIAVREEHEKSAGDKSGTATTTKSADAFAKSGFAKLSGAASPFGTLGGSKTGGGFGGLASSASPFGALGAASTITNTGLAAAPKLTFASAGSASPFASLNGAATKPFGSAFGSGFGGGGFGAPKLTNFAKPGGGLTNDKPAKPFGAPESDNEESDKEDEDVDESAADELDSTDKEKEKGADDTEVGDEAKVTIVSEDKKKALKLQKVEVDDGETGEATIFLGRAKAYHLDKASGAWKERGGGILKINVPEATVEFDAQSAPIVASFDASMLGGDDLEAARGPKVVRLIMRQDHTHRVVVNTAVLASTEFVKRDTLKATTFLFSALEGPEAKPISLQIKMSAANAELFQSTIDLIQAELKTLG